MSIKRYYNGSFEQFSGKRDKERSGEVAHVLAHTLYFVRRAECPVVEPKRDPL